MAEKGRLMNKLKKYVEIAVHAAIKAGIEILSIYNNPDADFSIEKKADDSPLTIADKNSHVIIKRALLSSNIPLLSEEGNEIPYSERKKWDTFWIVDPLDGTKEFIKRNGEFTVNIGLIKNGSPIAGIIYVPVSETLYIGIQNWGAFRINKAKAKITIADIETHGMKLPLKKQNRVYTIASSRSHLNEQTKKYIGEVEKHHSKIKMITSGSSLKICMVAEGIADEYPRFGPTMEWDTAAGHAIVKAAGKKIWLDDFSEELIYNKEILLNPNFIVK